MQGTDVYDGVPGPLLAERLGVPRLVLRATVDSALDEAHVVAASGAPDGTLVLADRQEAGRGRQGRAWASPAGLGIWLAMVRRVDRPLEHGVLALRVGLALAEALEEVGADAHLKWPNDVLLAGRKVAGILCEAREGWVALGVGINVTGQAPVDTAAVLDQHASGTTRVDVLMPFVPRLAGLRLRETLTPGELAAWARRDWLAGRDLTAPVRGRVRGLAADGALLVTTSDGERRIVGGTVTCSSQ